MSQDDLAKNIRRAKLHATVSWLVGLGLLAVGAYQIIGNPGLLIAFGIFGLTRGIANEINAVLYPVGVSTIQSLASTKGLAHE
jgi:hypothetical protein